MLPKTRVLGGHDVEMGAHDGAPELLVAAFPGEEHPAIADVLPIHGPVDLGK